MKKIYLIIVIALTASVSNAAQWKLKDALKGALKDSTAVSGIGSALSNMLSTDKITVDQMVGQWDYTAPAVTFRSDNILKKVGGAAASATIISKLEPVYAKLGFDKSQLTVNADSSFVLNAGRLTLKGTIGQFPDTASQANFVFRFAIAGKLKVADAETCVSKGANGNLSVMFDVSKLITLMELAGQFTGNSTVKQAVTLLKSYDGLCAGFEFKPVATKE